MAIWIHSDLFVFLCQSISYSKFQIPQGSYMKEKNIKPQSIIIYQIPFLVKYWTEDFPISNFSFGIFFWTDMIRIIDRYEKQKKLEMEKKCMGNF